MIFLITIAFTVIGLIEIPGLAQKKLWWELIIFSTLLSLGFLLSVLLTLGISLPYVSDLIGEWIKYLFNVK